MRALTLYGTGALACWVAGRLSAARAARVTMTGTWSAGLAAIAGDGVLVEEEGRRLHGRPGVRALGAPLPPADCALVLVKSHQTARVAAALAHGGAALHLRVVTLQNGLGNRELLEEAVSGERVRSGVVLAGARLVAPGRVRAFPGAVILQGTPDDRPMQGLARLLRRAGIDARLEADIEPHLWRKLAVNCAVNPLSALAGVPNGALLEDEGTRRTLEAAAREVEAVARARGVAFGPDAAELARAVAALTAGNRSSMLQDLDRGAPTEIEALCGAVVREARRLGVPAPVNARLWEQVRAREQARAAEAAPGP